MRFPFSHGENKTDSFFSPKDNAFSKGKESEGEGREGVDTAWRMAVAAS